jgi:signal recognition particle receptor subunit beta
LLPKADGAISNGVDGAVLLVDGTRSDSELRLREFIDQCETHCCPLLLIYTAAPLSPSTQKVLLQSTGAVRCLVVAADDEGFVESAKAFVEFIQFLHDDIVMREENLAKQKADYNAIQNKLRGRKPPKIMVQRQVDCSFGEPFPDAMRQLDIALIGAPNTGKTTFVTSLVDGFVLREYHPTTLMEVGSIGCDLGGINGRVNVNLWDGPIAAYCRSKACCPFGCLFVFLDVSCPYAIETAASAIEALDADLPPHIVVVAAKGNLAASDPVVSIEDLHHFAGSHGAYVASLDPRAGNRAFLAQFVASVIESEVHQRLILDRQFVCVSEAPHEYPTCERDIDLLFYSVDTLGTGLVAIGKAREIFERYNRAGFLPFEDAIGFLDKTAGVHRHRTALNKEEFALLMFKLISI